MTCTILARCAETGQLGIGRGVLADGGDRPLRLRPGAGRCRRRAEHGRSAAGPGGARSCSPAATAPRRCCARSTAPRRASSTGRWRWSTRRGDTAVHTGRRGDRAVRRRRRRGLRRAVQPAGRSRACRTVMVEACRAAPGRAGRPPDRRAAGGGGRRRRRPGPRGRAADRRARALAAGRPADRLDRGRSGGRARSSLASVAAADARLSRPRAGSGVSGRAGRRRPEAPSPTSASRPRDDRRWSSSVFACVYLGMALGRWPGLMLDRTGIALVGAIVLILGRRGRRRGGPRRHRRADPGHPVRPDGAVGPVRRLRLLRLVLARIAAHAASGRAPLLALDRGRRGVLSAVLANDVVVFAMTPMLASGLLRRGLDPRPFLIALDRRRQCRLGRDDHRQSAEHPDRPGRRRSTSGASSRSAGRRRSRRW